MEGLAFKYNTPSGQRLDLTDAAPQYIFLEPFEKLIIRYYITKEGLESNKTTITKESVDTQLITVKMRYTTYPFVSKVTDFDNISGRSSESSQITFEEEDQEVYLDVLYESHSEKRVRVKAKVLSRHADSFENENTVSDGPDEYVRMSNVQISKDSVSFNYMFRRSGRLRKYSGVASYDLLAQILKDRLFKGSSHVDADLPKNNINSHIVSNGWIIDVQQQQITKPFDNRYIFVSDKELADLIRDKASKAEILGLLQTNNVRESQHPIRTEAENFLVQCDRDCSLPAATLENVLDTRGQI